MNHDVTTAVTRLQARLSRTTNPWRAEQAEEALHILIASPDRAGNPQHLIRNALADAGKKLKRRTRLFTAYSDGVQQATTAANDNLSALTVELADLLDKGVSASDRSLLRVAVAEGEATEIAVALNIPLVRARERLSRARARARIAWGLA